MELWFQAEYILYQHDETALVVSVLVSVLLGFTPPFICSDISSFKWNEVWILNSLKKASHCVIAGKEWNQWSRKWSKAMQHPAIHFGV
ncbi:hypothetical protein VNO77_34998 [Canavalia gladiata]|uniref:Uncharacterized protein n=1 Tax=Canavalia gladiata TaxID=3824 RepID=A0AAN9KFP6_CANGL